MVGVPSEFRLDCPVSPPGRYQNHSWSSWFWPLMVQYSTPAVLVGLMVTVELPLLSSTFAASAGLAAEAPSSEAAAAAAPRTTDLHLHKRLAPRFEPSVFTTFSRIHCHF